MKTLRRTAVAFLACVGFLGIAALEAGAQAGRLPAPTVTHALPKPAGGPVPAIECPNCSDANPCTVDSCDPANGLCRHEPLQCDDGDPCTTDTCDPYYPVPPGPGCRHLRKPDGTACSASGSCVKAGVCETGVCRAAPEPEGTSCDTASACTEGGTCDASGRCSPGRPSQIGSPCDDGDPCTRDDACAIDEGGAPLCRGAARSCDDGNPCTIDSCGADDTCAHQPVACEDGNTCTTGTCDPRTGACTQAASAEGQSCAGPDRCTRATCVAGNCLSTGATGQICGNPGECGVGVCEPWNPVLCRYVADSSRCDKTRCDAASCDTNYFCRGAGNCHPLPCTRGLCDTHYGCNFVVPTPGATCNDGDSCTTNDVCGTNGVCQGTAAGCDDGNPCTVDRCQGGTCVHDTGPGSCDDGNPCTADACAGDGVSCEHAPIDGGACDDGNRCTSDGVCVAGACTAPPITCSDGNPCTDDVCDPATGCTHDQVACRDDGNACTAEVCNPANGCLSVPFTGGACDDDLNPCTIDRCAAGTCAHEPIPDGSLCAQSGCTVGRCHAGACAITDCDDHNDCTADVCTPGNTCIHPVDLEAECSDGNPCTANDACNPGPDGTAVCQGTLVSLPETCGTGACERTVDTCAGGVPALCTPGEPQPETCNGVDDDCDGYVDENRIMVNCMIKPLLLFDPNVRTTFAVVCRFRDRCAGNTDLPPAGVDLFPVYVTRADRLADPDDNVVAPDPSGLACPDPQRGSAFERGLVESTPARVLGGTTVTFNFVVADDGDCATLDGDRTALLARMKSTPDGFVQICVAGRYESTPWEGCGIAFLRHAPGSAE